jgi:hypothetical protein
LELPKLKEVFGGLLGDLFFLGHGHCWPSGSESFALYAFGEQEVRTIFFFPVLDGGWDRNRSPLF